MNNLLETREIGDYRINVLYDDCAYCPCKAYDNLGLFFWDNDSNYLSPYCDESHLFGTCDNQRHTMCDALRELVFKYVSQKKIIHYIKKYCQKDFRIRYEKSEHLWYLFEQYNKEWLVRETFYPQDFNGEDCKSAFCDILDEEDLTMLLYNCKDIAFYEWASTGYCQGDYVKGFTYCDKERFIKMCDTNTKDWKKRSLKLFEGEAECIGKWLCGDVYGYTLEKKVPYKKVFTDGQHPTENGYDYEEIESCWGFYMDSEELIDYVINEYGLNKKDAA